MKTPLRNERIKQTWVKLNRSQDNLHKKKKFGNIEKLKRILTERKSDKMKRENSRN